MSRDRVRGAITNLGLIALALGAGVAAPVDAQTPVCPPGYYYASDGQCYPGSEPYYGPPAYEFAPPVYQPPVVFDGFSLGLGFGDRFGRDDRGRGGNRGRANDRGQGRSAPVRGGGGRGGGGRDGHR